MSNPQSDPDLSNHHIIVTGGTGFLGHHIVQALHTSFPTLRITILDLAPSSPNHPTPSSPLIHNIHADITNSTVLTSIFTQLRPPPTIVIHSAGVVPTGTDRYTPTAAVVSRVLEINVAGTQCVLDAALAVGVGVFVYTGSCTTVTDDQGTDFPNFNEGTKTRGEVLLYGRSKGMAEQLVLEANSPSFLTCSIRPSVILGPGDYQLVPTIHHCITKLETPFVIGPAQNLYDFTYVTNVADAHVLAVRNLLGPKTAAGHAFHISNGQPIPFRDFCLAVWAEFGHVPPFTVRIPIWVAWIVGWVWEVLTWLFGTEATLSRGSVRDYTQTAYADLRRAREVLGYEARVGLRDGIRMSCKEYLERLEGGKLQRSLDLDEASSKPPLHPEK